MAVELFRVEEIALDEASKALLEDIDETARRVNEFRPLPTETVEGLLRDLLGERVFTSNAIEGSTLDLRETREVLRTGHIDVPKKREATEALNLGKAIEYTQENLIPAEAPLNRGTLLHLHGLLLRGINDDWAGRFRDRDVMIHAAKYQPPDATYVPDLVDLFFERLNHASEVHPVLLATWAHWAIARVHPFFDGNGRIARLWQDVILFRNNLTCVILRPEDRREYLSALESADENEFNPLTQLVAQRLAATWDKYLEAQRKSKDLEEWASSIVVETTARTAEQRKISYFRWSRKMEQLRFEFERCAARITEAAGDIELQLRPQEMIDQTKWEGLRSGAQVGDTSLFLLECRRVGQYLWYYFFFGKHYWSDLDTDDEKKEPRVSLLISEKTTKSGVAIRLGVPEYSGPLSLREIFLVDNQLVRKRYDLAQETDVFDRDIDPMVVAQDFIEEVLLRRFT